MNEPDLKALEDHHAFEHLCRDILIAEGCQNVRGLGTGPDQGKDILIDVPQETPLSTTLTPHVVQCKWVSKALGEAAIGDIIGYLEVHQAKGLLIISAAGFSGTATTKADAINRSTTHPYSVILWDHKDIQRRLHKHPWLIAKYWHRNKNRDGSARPDTDPFPNYARRQLLESLAPAESFGNLSVEWYATAEGYDEQLRRRILAHVEAYSRSPPVLTLIRGGVGSGKTSLAHVIQTAAGPLARACLHDRDFDRAYYAYLSAQSDRFPRLLAGLADLEHLIIDDCGHRMPDTEAPIAPPQILRQLIELRIREKRPTIITMVGDDEMPESIRRFLDLLAQQYPVLDLGPHDWRASPRRHAATEADATGRYSGYLSRHWLSEKLGKLEAGVEFGLSRLALSDEEVTAYSREMESRGYESVSRESLTREVFDGVLVQMRNYREFITSLPWDSIRFDDVELNSSVRERFVVRGREHDEPSDDPPP